MANPTPLDFESIGADRQAKIKELEGKNTRTLNDRAFNAGASNTFSTLTLLVQSTLVLVHLRYWAMYVKELSKM